jgi:hypothetical protein
MLAANLQKSSFFTAAYLHNNLFLSAGAVQGALSNTLAKKKEGRCTWFKPSLCSIVFNSFILIGPVFPVLVKL